MSKRNQKLGEVIKRMAMVASTINEPASTSTASADEPTEEDYAIQGPSARPLRASLHPAIQSQSTAKVEDLQPICGEGTTYEDAPDLHTGCARKAGHKGRHSDGDYSWDSEEPQVAAEGAVPFTEPLEKGWLKTALADVRAAAEEWGLTAQLESMPPAETLGFEHAVDESAQKIIDENKGTSMSAAYRQVAKDLYLALHSLDGEAVANEPWLKIEFTRKDKTSSSLLHSACGGATWESDQLKGIQRLKITRLKNDVLAGAILQLRAGLNAALERERILLDQLADE